MVRIDQTPEVIIILIRHGIQVNGPPAFNKVLVGHTGFLGIEHDMLRHEVARATEQSSDDLRVPLAAVIHGVILQPSEANGLQAIQMGLRAEVIQVIFLRQHVDDRLT